MYVQEVADLGVEVERGLGDTTVRLAGDLDKITAPLLKRRLAELSAEGLVALAIDARHLDFCDSSGLWTLVEHQRAVAGRGGSLRLLGVHGVLRRVLEVTGLTAVFDEVVPV
ncbi:STAS domain-containing protein [Nonomuraea sp. NPDC049637]|uniref:STAS domain-containing protein n=1 Tax=Nonomuraea sp. NPDC049637 TaxID=3154356 RepID=UPI003430376A